MRFLLRLGLGLLLVFTSTTSFSKGGGGSYLGLGYGIASTSSDFTYYDGIDGSTLMLTYGSNSGGFSWEFMGRKTGFDPKAVAISSGITIATEIDALMIGGGFRYFMMTIFNIHAGLGFSTVSYNAVITGTGSGIATSGDASGLGLYYGAGLQIPIGGMQLFVDYTINAFAGDVSSNEIAGGVRFIF